MVWGRPIDSPLKGTVQTYFHGVLRALITWLKSRAGLGRCLMPKGCQHVITGPFGPAMVHIMDHSIFRRADLLRKIEPMDLIFYQTFLLVIFWYYRFTWCECWMISYICWIEEIFSFVVCFGLIWVSILLVNI